MRLFRRRSGTAWKTRLPVALLVLAGLALSAAGLVKMLQWQREHRLEAFHQQAGHRISLLDASISGALDHVTRLGALFHAVPNLGPGGFRRYAGPVVERHSYLQALMWVPRVPDALRRGYEQEARAKGFPRFGFRERRPSGRLHRAGTRRVYFPVYFLQPLRGNRDLLGFDLGTRPEYRRAMEKAAATGSPAATGRVRLPRAGRDAFGFLVFHAVHAAPASPSETGRGGAPIGFVAGIYRIPGLLDLLPPPGPLPEAAPRLALFDMQAPTRRQLLYRGDSPLDATARIADHPHSSVGTLRVADRQWLAVVLPPDSLGSLAASPAPYAVFAGGLAVTALLGFYLRGVLARRARVEQEVVHITAALSETLAMARESEARFRDLTEAVSDWVWETDPRDRLVLLSSRFQEATGLPPSPYLGKSPAELEAIPGVPEFLLHAARALPSREPFRERVSRHRDPRGQWRTVRISGRPVFGQDGRFLGFRGVGADLTHLHRAEQALAETRHRLHAVIDNAPLLLFAWDDQGRIELAEGKALQALGLTREQCRGRPAAQVFGELPELLAALRGTLRGQLAFTTLHRNQVGFEFWVSPLPPGGRPREDWPWAWRPPIVCGFGACGRASSRPCPTSCAPPWPPSSATPTCCSKRKPEPSTRRSTASCA